MSFLDFDPSEIDDLLDKSEDEVSQDDEADNLDLADYTRTKRKRLMTIWYK